MKCEWQEQRPDFVNDNSLVSNGSGMFTDSVVKSKNDCHMVTLFYKYTLHYYVCFDML